MTLHARPLVEVSVDATGPDVPGCWTDVTEWVRLMLDDTRAGRSWFTWGPSTWGNTSGES